ncbi:MAG: hypothetical protein WC866_01400 [Patescibacteria group bacterium]|jgi:hypothetical protein
MRDPNSYVIPDVGKNYGRGFKKLFITFWILAALLGTAVAVGLGLSRNDWLVFTSAVSTETQAIGGWVALGSAFGAAGILSLYGLLAAFVKRQWLLLLPCLAVAGSFPALLYAPHWVPFAFGGGATLLGAITLKIVDRRDQKRVAASAKSKK